METKENSATEPDTAFYFDSARLLRCIRHALVAKEHRDTNSRPLTQPSLIVVRDCCNHVFAMSSGWPRDVANTNRTYAVYADNCKCEDNLEVVDNEFVAVNYADNICGSFGIIEILPLHISQVGHCYEELMAQLYEKYYVTPTRSAEDGFTQLRPNSKIKARHFDKENEAGMRLPIKPHTPRTVKASNTPQSLMKKKGKHERTNQVRRQKPARKD